MVTMKNSPLRKFPIDPKEGNRPDYKGSEDYHSNYLYGEKDTEHYKDKE